MTPKPERVRVVLEGVRQPFRSDGREKEKFWLGEDPYRRTNLINPALSHVKSVEVVDPFEEEDDDPMLTGVTVRSGGRVYNFPSATTYRRDGGGLLVFRNNDHIASFNNWESAYYSDVVG